MTTNGTHQSSPEDGALQVVIAERDAARQQMMAINQECVNRAMPRVNELLDALNQLSLNARMGNQIAKQQLSLFFKALEEARVAAMGGESGVPILRR